MVLGGLWHGAAWTYVLWGAYQGALLMAFRTGGRMAGARGRRRWLETPGRARVGVVLMFHLTCYGWLIFRANSVGQIARHDREPGRRAWRLHVAARVSYVVRNSLFFAGPLLVIHALRGLARRSDGRPRRCRPASRYAICAVLFY